MRTRRDQVQAYRFVTRRIVSALLSGDPETTNLPMRRLGLAVVGSVVAAAVVLGGVGAYGQLTGNAAPLEENTLVIERETGATYVYVEGLLHPTLNYASARLILNEPQPAVRTMSQASIADRPRGRTVGIVGAPDALPEPKSLVELPWSVCDVPDPADPRRSTTRVAIDRPLSGGTPLGERGVLVTAGGERYLLTRDARLRIAGGDPAIAALKMAGAPALNVGEQLLNAVPAGPVLREPDIPGDGEVSRFTVGDGRARVGEVFRAAGLHYVLTREGLAQIGEVTALLLQRDGRRITEITPDQAGRLFTDQRLDAEGTPQALPTLQPVRAGQTVLCATYRRGAPGGPPVTTLEVFDRLPAELNGPALPVRQSARDAVRTAEQVLLPGGKGVLAQAAPGAGEGGTGAAGATVYLIGAQGVRYPLDAEAQQALGYEGVTPLAVPASLLSLIPTGPTLRRKDAFNYFAPGATTSDGAGRTPASSPSRSASPEASRSASPEASGTPDGRSGDPAAGTSRTPTGGAGPTADGGSTGTSRAPSSGG
ncbi:type VII secretion protein EccB [Micromonospora olivasterospora]|uniref:type VII secretion protein EccB n=1 Tax=Micromonospora olivasterospora TaxID=1880 RepID=UPI0031E3C74F